MDERVRFRHLLSCGCEFVTDLPLLMSEIRCMHHDAPALLVEHHAHVWNGMRRRDVALPDNTRAPRGQA